MAKKYIIAEGLSDLPTVDTRAAGDWRQALAPALGQELPALAARALGQELPALAAPALGPELPALAVPAPSKPRPYYPSTCAPGTGYSD